MADPDIYSLFLGDGPTAQQQALALAQALRQRRGEADANRGLATATALGQNPLLSGISQAAMENANALGQGITQQQGMLAQAAQGQAQRQMQQQEHSLQRAMEAQRLAEEQRYHNAEIGLRRQGMELGKYSQGPMGIINNRTGELVAGPAGTGDAGDLPPLGTRARKQLDALNSALGNDISRDMHLNKGLQERLQASERVKAVAVDPTTGQTRKLTPGEVTEMVAASASLLSGGGHPPESLVHQMIPSTTGMDWAKIVQRFSNNPQDAEADAFVRLMLNQAQREETTINRQILRNQLRATGKHSQFIKQYPQVAWPTLQAQGITKEMFGPEGLPLPQYLQDAAEPQHAAAGQHGGNIDLAAPVTKTVNGKRYVFENGQWFQED